MSLTEGVENRIPAEQISCSHYNNINFLRFLGDANWLQVIQKKHKTVIKVKKVSQDIHSYVTVLLKVLFSYNIENFAIKL